jgi:kinesin family protein 5
MFNHHETVSTLRFGERAKRIKNKPKINKEVTVAELKIEIENLEKIIHKGNNRILQLDHFIVKNNLKVPSEDDFSFMNEFKLLDSLTHLDLIHDDADNLIINEEINFNNEGFINSDKSAFGSSTPKKKTSDLFKLNKRNSKELDEKLFTLRKLNYFSENDNKNVSESIDNAISVINNYALPVEDKDSLQKELEVIKNKHELLEHQLYEKINELQEKLDLENRAFNKIENKVINNNISAITQKPISSFNLQDDKYDIFEESNNKNKAAIGLSNNTNANLYSLTEAEGEIIKKIKEIQTELNDEEFNNLISSENKIEGQVEEKAKVDNVNFVTFNNVQKVKVKELFELIKDRFFNGIGINYDFENNQTNKNEEIALQKQMEQLNDNVNSKENNGNFFFLFFEQM